MQHSGQQQQVGVRSAIKGPVFWVYVNILRSVPRQTLRLVNKQRIVVLVYHRVNDQLRDKVTVGIDQFDEQIAWLARNYPVVSIEDVVHRRVARNTTRPAVAITFDDGYHDNYLNAVPILRRHGVPAAFFVSTGMIGSGKGFAHDLQKLGYALPNMTWDQLKEMHREGFTIGAHTVSHLNCAKNDLKKVRAELIESRDTLRDKLGIDRVIFAYPFGGRTDITPEALRLVRDLDYIGCCSAYGGVIRGEIDPFDVPRVGINCNFSMLAFRARLEGFDR